MKTTGLTALVVILASASPASAQRLPVRHYTLADGLPHNSVTALRQDRKGYLWIGTAEGLARFDGYHFVSYGTADGLAHGYIQDLAEDPHGHLWIATQAGVSRLIDELDRAQWATPRGGSDGRPAGARQKFVSYPVGPTPTSNVVNAIGFDRAGVLWCATYDGLYRARLNADEIGPFESVAPYEHTSFNNGLADSRGRLWFWLVERGLIQVTADRIVAHPQTRDDRSGTLLEDRTGQVWLANRDGIFEHTDATGAPGDASWRSIPLVLTPRDRALSALRDSKGTLWIVTTQGLMRSSNGRATVYGIRHGLTDLNRVLLEDRAGNMWVGSRASGVYQVSGDSLVSYTMADGLPAPAVDSVFEGADGRIYAHMLGSTIVEITEDGITPVTGGDRLQTERWPRRPFVDAQGHWWVVRSGGVCRVSGPPLRLDAPVTCLTNRLSLPWSVLAASSSMDIPEMYQDPAGRLWFATADAMYRVRPGAPDLERLPLAFSRKVSGLNPVFADRRGAIWLMSAEEMGRWFDGRVELFDRQGGLPEIRPRSMLVDRAGRLWVGMRHSGVAMTVDPAAEHPRWVTYTTREGLSSDTVWSITEDDLGRVYFGTGRGLDRLDLVTGRIRHFTTADGLAGDLVTRCIKDRRGNIWVATSGGVSRLDPRNDAVTAAPLRTWLSRVQVNGEDLRLPETGIDEAPPLQLSAHENNLILEYVALGFGTPGDVRYQYRLDGVDRDWGAPTDQRSVNYARLSPGSYRFAVRAVNRDGLAGSEFAVMGFEIVPPLWRRMWFIAIVTASLTGGLLLHRLRVRRLLAMDRIRRQIATDLHDDIGAGLAEVAILSEVAKRHAAAPDSLRLGEIARLARSMRESMSDIVWAVDPRKDRFTDLVRRMRQVALNALASDGVRVEFNAPAGTAIDRIGLAPNRRRHLLLILKEAVTNVATHARATHVEIDLTIEGRELALRIRDDGVGFDPGGAVNGQGLESLARRTHELGGRLAIDSAPGRGTTIAVRVALRN